MINKFDHKYIKINYKNILDAYCNGIFPMAESIDSSDVFWVKPKNRGVINPYKINIRRKLKRFINTEPFKIKINTDFIGVIEACSEITNGRENTWINPSIRDVFIELHYKGYAHSVECYSNNDLVGGLYGVAIGGMFFGESMFSRMTNASKVALLHLIDRLKVGNFVLLDTQFITEHLKTMGAYEIDQESFLIILKKALKINSDFYKMSKSGELDINLYPKSGNYT